MNYVLFKSLNNDYIIHMIKKYILEIHYNDLTDQIESISEFIDQGEERYFVEFEDGTIEYLQDIDAEA